MDSLQKPLDAEKMFIIIKTEYCRELVIELRMP